MAEIERGEEEKQRRGMRYREAGPYLALLTLPGADADDINEVIGHVVIPSRHEDLKTMASACSLVSLLQKSVLPSLRRAPADAAHLLMLDACARNLRGYGLAVGGGGGCFRVSCEEVVQRIGSYTAVARGRNGSIGGDHASLRGSVDDLRALASRFLDMTYTPEADTAEGFN